MNIREPVPVEWRVASLRASLIFLLWLIVAGTKPTDLIVGALATIIVTWLSLRLLPATTWHFRPIKLTRYAAHFLYQSITAGIDVARLALDPRARLQPGLVVYRTRLPAGATLDAFCTVSSLLPGTLPAGSDVDGQLSIHCLDVTQPVADQLSKEEALFVEALEERRSND